MAYKRKDKRRIAVIDFETDPFLADRFPRPFAWGFYDGERYVEYWQSDAWNTNECTDVLVNFLLGLPRQVRFSVLHRTAHRQNADR